MKRPGKTSSDSQSTPPKERSEPPRLAVPLHQIQKMQVFGELVGGVAHDFNNLLSIFHGYTEILQTELAPDNPLQEYLSEMTAAVERAKTLTSQLLNFSRTTPSAPRALRLESVLLEFRKMLRRMIGEKIELVLEMEDACGWVMADPREIETLLTNLVVNACEAMPQGGRLSLELTDVVIARTSRRIKAGLAPGAYVQLAIRDTGVGMEQDLLPRIFEQGFTTKPPGRNTGLGLAVGTGIVEHSGGKIFAESTPGKGSTFTVFLPRLQSPPPEKPLQKQKEVFSGKGENILIVEDDAPVRKNLAARMRRLGYRALCAANGDAALRILETEREIRLVIADIIMPLMGGVELAEIIRQRWPGTKIALTSGYVFDPPTDTISNYDAFLPKPISSGALIHNLRNLLDA